MTNLWSHIASVCMQVYICVSVLVQLSRLSLYGDNGLLVLAAAATNEKKKTRDAKEERKIIWNINNNILLLWMADSTGMQWCWWYNAAIIGLIQIVWVTWSTMLKQQLLYWMRWYFWMDVRVFSQNHEQYYYLYAHRLNVLMDAFHSSVFMWNEHVKQMFFHLLILIVEQTFMRKITVRTIANYG